MDVLLAVCFVVYFVPCVVASWKEHPREGWIFLLTLLTGWTGLGWVLALVWATRAPTPPSEEPAVLARREHLRLLDGGGTALPERRPPRRARFEPRGSRR